MKKILSGILSRAGAGLFGGNLVKHGDFTQLKNLNGHAKTNGGRASLFTEDYTWNKCAKLEIDKVVKTVKNTELTAACIWLGCDSKRGGFPVKPNKTYRFSVELKGSRPFPVSVNANLWDEGKGVWQGKAVRSSLGSVNISSEWKKYSGTFKTGKKSAKAALQIQMWHDTQYGPHRFKVGDYVLIDNVTVEEVRMQMNAAPSAQMPEVSAKKSALIADTAEAVRDFQVLRQTGKKSELTSFSVRKKDSVLQIDIECQEPGKIAVGKGVWDGDAVEIFFVRNGRIMQFAAGAGGALFSTDKLPWKADCRVEKDKWSVTAEIPFSSIGGKLEYGDTISFNLARQRLNTKEFLTWSALKESFHESDRFGMLVMGDYGAAFEKQYGKKLADSGR